MSKWTDGGRTDARKIMLLSHTITMRGSDVASLIEFRLQCLGGDSVADKWMDDGLTDGRPHGKNNVALAHP